MNKINTSNLSSFRFLGGNVDLGSTLLCSKHSAFLTDQLKDQLCNFYNNRGFGDGPSDLPPMERIRIEREAVRNDQNRRLFQYKIIRNAGTSAEHGDYVYDQYPGKSIESMFASIDKIFDECARENDRKQAQQQTLIDIKEQLNALSVTLAKNPTAQQLGEIKEGIQQLATALGEQAHNQSSEVAELKQQMHAMAAKMAVLETQQATQSLVTTAQTQAQVPHLDAASNIPQKLDDIKASLDRLIDKLGNVHHDAPNEGMSMEQPCSPDSEFADLANMANQTTRLINEHATLKKENESLRQKIDGLETTQFQDKLILQNYEKEIEKVRKELETKKEEISEIENKKANLESNLEALTEDYKKYKANSEQLIDETQQLIETAQKEAAGWARQINALDEEKRSLEENAKKLDENAKKLEEKVKTLSKEKDGLQSKVESNEETIQTLREELQQLQDDLSKKDREVEALKKQLEEARSNVAKSNIPDTKAQSALFKSMRRDKKAAEDAAEINKKVADKEIRQNQQIIEGLKKHLLHLTSQIEKEKGKVKQLESEKGTLREENEQNKKKLEELTAEIKFKKSAEMQNRPPLPNFTQGEPSSPYGGLAQVLATTPEPSDSDTNLSKENAELKAQVEQLNALVERLQDKPHENSDLSERVTVLQSANDELQAKIKRLETENKDLQNNTIHEIEQHAHSVQGTINGRNELGEEIGEVAAELGSVRNSLQKGLTQDDLYLELRKRNRELKEENTELLLAQNEDEQRRPSNSVNIGTQTIQVETTGQENDGQSQQTSEPLQQFALLQGEQEKLTHELETVKSENARLTQQLHTAQATTQTAKAKLDKLRLKSQAEQAEMNTELEKSKNENDRKDQELKKAQEELERVNRDLQTTKSELEKNTTSLKQLLAEAKKQQQRTSQNQTKEIETLKRRIAELQTQKLTLEQKITTLNTTMQDQIAKKTEAFKQTYFLEREALNNKHKKELDKSYAENETLKKTVEAKETEIAQLNAKLESLNEVVNNIKKDSITILALLDAKHQELSSKISRLQDEVTEKDAQVREQSNQTQTQELHEKIRNLTKEKEKLEKANRELNEANERLREHVEVQKRATSASTLNKKIFALELELTQAKDKLAEAERLLGTKEEEIQNLRAQSPQASVMSATQLTDDDIDKFLATTPNVDELFVELSAARTQQEEKVATEGDEELAKRLAKADEMEQQREMKRKEEQDKRDRLAAERLQKSLNESLPPSRDNNVPYDIPTVRVLADRQIELTFSNGAKTKFTKQPISGHSNNCLFNSFLQANAQRLITNSSFMKEVETQKKNQNNDTASILREKATKWLLENWKTDQKAQQQMFSSFQDDFKESAAAVRQFLSTKIQTLLRAQQSLNKQRITIENRTSIKQQKQQLASSITTCRKMYSHLNNCINEVAIIRKSKISDENKDEKVIGELRKLDELTNEFYNNENFYKLYSEFRCQKGQIGTAAEMYALSKLFNVKVFYITGTMKKLGDTTHPDAATSKETIILHYYPGNHYDLYVPEQRTQHKQQQKK